MGVGINTADGKFNLGRLNFSVGRRADWNIRIGHIVFFLKSVKFSWVIDEDFVS